MVKSVNANKGEITLDIGNFDIGIYYLKVLNPQNETIGVSKFIVTR